jgi:hypothetical protein
MKEIPGYRGYFASEDGKIISTRSGQQRVLKQRIHKSYLHVQISKDTKRSVKVKMPVHQLVLMAYVGNKPEGFVCRHLNGNPLDNRVENLKWGTALENIQDSIRHGTAACLRFGEKSLAAKLKTVDVLEIERRARSGEPQKKVASDYQINQKHVSDIKLHRTWKHLWEHTRMGG